MGRYGSLININPSREREKMQASLWIRKITFFPSSFAAFTASRPVSKWLSLVKICGEMRKFPKFIREERERCQKTTRRNLFDPLAPHHSPGLWWSLFSHMFPYTCVSVLTFQNLAKQNKFQAKTMFTTGKTVGLAEWIIDNTCLFPFVKKKKRKILTQCALWSTSKHANFSAKLYKIF